MNPIDLIAEARALCAEATEGPWLIEDEDGPRWLIADVSGVIVSVVSAAQPVIHAEHDAALIARARTLLPAVADALEAHRSALLDLVAFPLVAHDRALTLLGREAVAEHQAARLAEIRKDAETLALRGAAQMRLLAEERRACGSAPEASV